MYYAISSCLFFVLGDFFLDISSSYPVCYPYRSLMFKKNGKTV